MTRGVRFAEVTWSSWATATSCFEKNQKVVSLNDVTRMPDDCTECGVTFTDVRPLYIWMASYGDEVAQAWHDECLPPTLRVFLNEPRG